MKISRYKLWLWLSNSISVYYRIVRKMDIGKDVIISWRATLERGIAARGIHIGDDTQVLAGSRILAHDNSRSLMTNTYIGKNCIIGVGAIIGPGVEIGDECVIGMGSVVTRNIPPHSIAVGNPAKVIKTDVSVCKGRIVRPGVRVNKQQDEIA